jgi:hypothetical protein
VLSTFPSRLRRHLICTSSSSNNTTPHRSWVARARTDGRKDGAVIAEGRSQNGGSILPSIESRARCL